MKISLSWLSDYVELPGSPDELARRLTMAGLEVEAIERPGAALNGVVVAQIVESNKHPDADKLSVTKIDAGKGAPLQVVCGAKNYKVGDKVPLATVGTKLPNGTEIKASALRGVDSFGMLCSSRELGLSEEHAGLLILDPALKIGTPIAEALGMNDSVLEVNVTPNRPDALSHLGIARELGTLLGKPVKLPAPKLSESSKPASEAIAIRIEDPTRCVRYGARVIEGVKVGPSPAWMQQRLKACGVRAINNLVDVGNYVMLEWGQPLHAFDLDRIGGAQINVRTAKAGEKITTLDGKERVLSPEDLLISDRESALVIAGVMGGASSEVTEKTTRVLLEAATFQPMTVRRSAKRHALHTESSHRFERGADVSNIPAVLDRAAALIAELGGGQVRAGRVDAYPKAISPRQVKLRPARVGELLGVAVPEAESKRILEALGFKQLSAQSWEVPLARVDVGGEEDLIEEIARIRGYDAIPLALPPGLGKLAPEPASAIAEKRIRNALAGAGLDEAVNYSFIAPAELAAFGAEGAAISVTNPLSAEQSVMRTSLLPSLVLNVVRSARHQAQGVRFYELARTYRPDPEGGGPKHRPVAIERLEVAGVLWGLREGVRTWTTKEAAVDFYDAKSAVESLLAVLHIENTRWQPLESPWYHPRAAATVLDAAGKPLGTVGELHPRAQKRLDAPAGVFLFQLDFEALLSAAQLQPLASPLNRFPAVLRDLAVVVPVTLENEAIRRLIVEVGAPLVEDARVFDVYTGKPIPEGQKNIAYALRYRADDRTLTDVEVGTAHAKIVAEVNQRLGGSLRS
jgi:phenylalanyl-tRNA synthetase beta chain